MMPEHEPRVTPPDFNQFLWDLHAILKPLVERRMLEKYRKKHGVEWWKGVEASQRFGQRTISSDFLSSPENVLDIVSRFYGSFERELGANSRALIADLRNARNWISHTEIPLSTAFHITDSFLTLFKKLGQNPPTVIAKRAELEGLIVKNALRLPSGESHPVSEEQVKSPQLANSTDIPQPIQRVTHDNASAANGATLTPWVAADGSGGDYAADVRLSKKK